MALLTAIRPTSVGVVSAGAAVASSDTIAAADLGSRGAYLVINNAGASPDVVAILDGNFTPAGNAGASAGGSVTNGTIKSFYIDPMLLGANSVVTVTHSFITTVTYQLFPIG
jgi:hypothetical protein